MPLDTPDLEKELKSKRDPKDIVIDWFARMVKSSEEVAKVLDKLPKLKINLEMKRLNQYNEKLEACHIVLRTNNVILKKLTVIAREKMRRD